MTHEQVAEALQIDRTYISAIEHNRRDNINTRLLVSAANLFNVTASYLVGDGIPPIWELINYLSRKSILPMWSYEAYDHQGVAILRELGYEPEKICASLQLPFLSSWEYRQQMGNLEHDHRLNQ